MDDKLLWASAAVFALVLPVGAVLSRGRSWVRLAVQGAALAVATALLAPALGSPLAPQFVSGPWETRLVEQGLALAWWLLAARVAVLVTRTGIGIANPSREARILSDVLAGVIQVAALLAVVAFVFQLPVRGLLATSGVIAIVLGLALQSTVGDLFSGLAVGAERPYRPGDVLSVDGVTGRVIEVNWRSTHLAVGHDVAVIPNGVVAKSRLLNRSAPLAPTGESIEVRLDPSVPPEEALVVLEAALEATPGLRHPGLAPSVACTGLAGDGTLFTLQFAAASVDAVGRTRSELLARVHRHLRFAGMGLAVAGTVPSEAAARPVAAGIDLLLARSMLFGEMEEGHRAKLAAQFVPVEFAPDEALFAEGDRPEALFVVAAGVIEIRIGPAEAPRLTRRMSPGEAVGVVALINGEPQRASARAATIARVFRLGGAELASALDEMPALAADLELAVARALAAMARAHAETVEEPPHAPDAFGQRLRVFVQRLLAAKAED